MMFLSLLVSCLVAWKLLKEKGVPNNYIGYSLFFSVVCILIFSKQYTLIEHSNANLTFWSAGFSSIGGVIGLFVSIIFFDILYDKDKHVFLSCYGKVIPLLYSISKLGCFFVGCCHGFVYEGIGCVIYDHGSYFPVQLVESIVFFCIFLFIYKQKNLSISTVILLCAFSKFALDYLRYRQNGLNVSTNQMMCFVFILISVISIGYHQKVKKLN